MNVTLAYKLHTLNVIIFMGQSKPYKGFLFLLKKEKAIKSNGWLFGDILKASFISYNHAVISGFVPEKTFTILNHFYMFYYTIKPHVDFLIAVFFFFNVGGGRLKKATGTVKSFHSEFFKVRRQIIRLTTKRKYPQKWYFIFF